MTKLNRVDASIDEKEVGTAEGRLTNPDKSQEKTTNLHIWSLQAPYIYRGGKDTYDENRQGRATLEENRGVEHISKQALTPAQALSLVQSDQKYQETTDILLRHYSNVLVDPTSVPARLARLAADCSPELGRRRHIVGPKFEREVSEILLLQWRMQGRDSEGLKLFTYTTLNREKQTIPILHILYLKQCFEFSNHEIAHFLGCNVRHVARMSRNLRDHGLSFYEPKTRSLKPFWWPPLPKKMKFDRHLTPNELEWVDAVRKGRQTCRLGGRVVSGPEAADRLKKILHREAYNPQYKEWVFDKRTTGKFRQYDPDWTTHPDGKPKPARKAVRSELAEDEEQAKQSSYNRQRSETVPRPPKYHI